MSWLQILQLIFGIIQNVAPVIATVGHLQTAVNATPGTPEHTAAVTALKAVSAPTPPPTA
jgi:hypothetical protein